MTASPQHISRYLVTCALQGSYVGQYEHRLMVFPEAVLEAARRRCPGADAAAAVAVAAAATADNAAAQDVHEATGLPAAYSNVLFCGVWGCK